VRLPVAERENEGSLFYAFRKYYAPALLSTYARVTVLMAFIAWLCASIAVLNRIELGLDSKLSVPQDSYVLAHFNAMHDYLSVGPPVYFVVGENIAPLDKHTLGACRCAVHFRTRLHRAQIYCVAVPAAMMTRWPRKYITRPSIEIDRTLRTRLPTGLTTTTIGCVPAAVRLVVAGLMPTTLSVQQQWNKRMCVTRAM
jgi:hypothetical protein